MIKCDRHSGSGIVGDRSQLLWYDAQQLHVGQNLDEDERALAMNLTPVYEQWRKETLQEGRQEGIQVGLQQGERSLILRQLSRRFGVMSPDLKSQVEVLPLNRLEALGEALLDFKNTDDLMAWLRSN
jgi:predicted transposase YdaD